MAVFPSYSSIPYTDSTVTIRTKTLTNTFDNEGIERRKRKNLYRKRDVSLAYQYLTKTNARTLWQFYCDRDGSYEAFNFFDHQINTYEGEYVGVGDASETLFNVPGKTCSAYTVYVDGVEKTETTEYTWTQEGGTDGADEIEFLSAPAAGAVVTVDFTGYLKVHCRFVDDNLERQLQILNYEHLNVQLKGLINE